MPTRHTRDSVPPGDRALGRIQISITCRLACRLGLRELPRCRRRRRPPCQHASHLTPLPALRSLLKAHSSSQYLLIGCDAYDEYDSHPTCTCPSGYRPATWAQVQSSGADAVCAQVSTAALRVVRLAHHSALEAGEDSCWLASDEDRTLNQTLCRAAEAAPACSQSYDT